MLATAAVQYSEQQDKNVKKSGKNKGPAKESTSFAMNLFRGVLEPKQVFPYPDVLTDDQKALVQELLPPVTKVFRVSFLTIYYIVHIFISD